IKGECYPPQRRSTTLKKSTDCKYCDLNSQYIEILDTRLDDFEGIFDRMAQQNKEEEVKVMPDFSSL
ncbi:12866_t:CDS:1, partial [Ambispora gerdemannii]